MLFVTLKTTVPIGICNESAEVAQCNSARIASIAIDHFLVSIAAS
jgi:hypothetical protein